MRRKPKGPDRDLTPAERERLAVELAGLRSQLRERREMIEGLVKLTAFFERKAER